MIIYFNKNFNRFCIRIQDTSYIELVYQPESPDIPQFDDDSFLNVPDDDFSAYALRYALNEELSLLRLRDNWLNYVIVERYQELPSSHIISFLHKKNHWHQSSDDEPLPHIYS